MREQSKTAKALRDAEVAAGGEAPRLLSIDDYFLVEVEREVVEDAPTPGVKSRKCAAAKLPAPRRRARGRAPPREWLKRL